MAASPHCGHAVAPIRLKGQVLRRLRVEGKAALSAVIATKADWCARPAPPPGTL
jgi:hypothetical protein